MARNFFLAREHVCTITGVKHSRRPQMFDSQPYVLMKGDCSVLHDAQGHMLRVGRALLVYWCHLGGVCRGVMHAWCPGLMHVQRPGRRVASCSSCRRVEPLCGVVGLRWGPDITRLCVCLWWFPALVPACICLPTTRVLQRDAVVPAHFELGVTGGQDFRGLSSQGMSAPFPLPDG